IGFMIDEEGNVSDIKALTNHGFGMEQEVIRILKLSLNWNPVIKDGQKVKAYRRLPLSFKISSDGFERKRRAARPRSA
ncbi:MAG: energy transducer TonB, partial [Chitinophagaceae bacterium]